MVSLPQPQVLFTNEEVKKAVVRLALEIKRDYLGKELLVVGILKGSFVFMADLIREMGLPVEVEFVQLSSYGTDKETSGRIKVVKRLTTPLRGRHVLVVEDIIDTGLSVNFLLNYLSKKKPASLKLCVLLDKMERRQVPVPIDYLGFAVPNKFIVGYGIDWNEKFRYLPDVCFIE